VYKSQVGVKRIPQQAKAMQPAKPSPPYAYNLGKAARIQALLLAHEQA
jgi:hypothetical protein